MSDESVSGSTGSTGLASLFRPLGHGHLKNVEGSRIAQDFQKDRAVHFFIVFRLTRCGRTIGTANSTRRREILDRATSIWRRFPQVRANLDYTINEDESLRIDDFYNLLFKKLKKEAVYYGRSGLRYFLYEYELSLALESRQRRWTGLISSKTEGEEFLIDTI